MPKKPVRQVEQWDYVFPDERDLPASEQSVFTLAPLDIDERARAGDERSRMTDANGKIATELRTGQWALGLVLAKLVTTANVPSDAPAAYPGPDAPLERRKRWINDNLHDVSVMVLGLEIYERSALGPPEKNS